MDGRMYCATCGTDRTVPPSAADPGPCPRCGGTMRSSVRPDYQFAPGVSAAAQVIVTSNCGGNLLGGLGGPQ